jgi:hypothetical protein
MSAQKITKTITLPDGDVMTIRKLSAKGLRKAAEAQMFHSADLMERMSGVRARVRAALGVDPVEPTKAEPKADDEPVVEEVVDPMAGYEAHTLILKGLTAVVGETWADEDAKAAYVDDLSEEDVAFASREILQLSAPKLFLSKAEKAAEQKNG